MHLGWFAMNTSRYVTKIQKAAIVTVEMLRKKTRMRALYLLKELFRQHDHLNSSRDCGTATSSL